MNALVIDDSRGARILLSKILTQFGFVIHDEPLATKALSHLEHTDTSYDIAFVDVFMPEMNGIEFVRHVRSNSKYDQMFLLMVTSDASESRMMEAMEAGADEYLIKPVDKQALRAKLEFLGFTFRS